MENAKLQPKIGDIWYRYVDRRYASIHDDEWGPTQYVMEQERYTVFKLTPKGAWLMYGEHPGLTPEQLDRLIRSEGHWVAVRDNPGKQFAYPTAEAALHSYLARKERQINILSAQLEAAKRFRNQALNRLMSEQKTVLSAS